MRKSLISFLFIFAYSIGFAHQLIPHLHIGDNPYQQYAAVSVVHTEQHKYSEAKDFNDVAHLDHLDNNLYDYLVCLLSESGHSEWFLSADGHFPTVDAGNSDKDYTPNCALFETSFERYQVQVEEEKNIFGAYIGCIYSSPSADSDPNRGPPSISC